MANNPHTAVLHARDEQLLTAEASGTITPGDAIEVSGQQTSGVDDEPQVQRQSTDGEGGRALKVATEYAKTGRGIDDDYSSEDDVEYRHALPGERYYMFHNTAEDISYGAQLVLSGDGTLRALDTAGGDVEADIVAEARGAVSNSTGTAKTRVPIEVV